MLSRRIATAVSLLVGVVAVMGLGASPALAESHPKIGEFGSFTNPNGIAVEESTGDVYVADIGTGTVSKFDASGNPVPFTCGAECATYVKGNEITGSSAGPFSFPEVYGDPAQVAVDNSTDPSDPSRGDLYVLDAGHNVIDKFNAKGEYLSQITGLEVTGLAVSADGDLVVSVQPGLHVDLFDNALANDLLKQLTGYETIAYESESSPEPGFALSPTGDYYMLFEGCGCVDKLGGGDLILAPLGRVDQGPGDVAMAVDPVSGHLYVDDQSNVVEFDTGGMDWYERIPDSSEDMPTAAEALSFGSAELKPAGSGVPRGGIAVNGASGEIYVSNPADGKVYVYSSTPPAPAAGTAANVTQTGATLRGSVDPRAAAVTECLFEYEKAAKGTEGFWFTPPVTVFTHSAPCVTEHGEPIGSGTSPVAVSAEIGGLEPGELYHFRLVAGNASGTSPSEGMFATQNTGFGVKSLGVEFLNQEGQPDTQAGSHPYEMVTSFAFKTAPQRFLANADSPYRLRPVGNVKDIIFDAPPGLVGNPNATERKCTINELENFTSGNFEGEAECPPGSQVGEMHVETPSYGTGDYPIYNMVPPRGVAAQFGIHVKRPNSFINAGVQAGGQYPLESQSLDIPAIEPVFSLRVTLFGVVGSGESRRPFLTLPTGCTGPLRSTIKVDSYQDPGKYAEKEAITENASGEPVALSGCSKLKFPPAISVAPDVTNASSSSGLKVGIQVPQTAAFNPAGLAESALRDTTVALPAGVAINPSGGGGLEACSEGLAGFTGFQEFNKEFEPGVQWATFTPTQIASLQPNVSFCPNGSKIGTVKIKTYLLDHELEGAVYLAAQDANPFGSLMAMYMLVEDPVSGSTVKLAGEVRLCENTGEVINGVSCQTPGQIIATFQNTPDLPFEELELHFYGGERAPLSTPSHCGTYTTQASFTPWDGNAPVNTTSSFNITSGPNGSPCPGASLPFNPTAAAGATNIQAGSFSPFTFTMSRADGEQNLQSGEAKLPPGISAVLSGVELCAEPQANEGLCGPNSLIGETTISVGVGSEPFTVKGGKIYLTGPYNGQGACAVGTPGCAPFGLSIVNPAKAGPFDLADTPNNHPPCDCVLVRAKIEINPLTSAITISSNLPGTPDSIPTMLEGIPLQIQHVNVTTTRSNFQFNATNCAKTHAVGVLHSAEGGTDTITVPFQVTNCAALKFEPKFSVSTSGKTSRANGASLTAKLTYPSGSLGKDANISKVKVDLPKQLPSRLTTLQKACIAAQFESNPAGCPAASRVGHAKAITPILPVPLTGPAYFVSHGGAKFPELIVVLQGYGVRIDLHGETFISKAGITSSTFSTVPDQPLSSFELTLPEGKYSALAANGNLCKSKLAMPTSFVAQNGAAIKQSTPIAVTGCKPTITIVSHSVKGNTATVTVGVPSAGKLVASGNGLSGAAKSTGKAATVTLALTLSKQDRLLLAQHPGRKLRLSVKLLFTPKHGSRLSSSVTVLMG